MTQTADRAQPFDAAQAVRLAHDTFDIEAAAVLGLKARTGTSFAQAVQQMLACTGRVVVMGMGKSGHIGRKISATLASTGTPAMFVHPAEASHGDLGMITPGDVVLAISNSGESEELTAILPVLKRQGVPLIAITGGSDSTLARHAGVVLDSSVDKEACPLNLAPTASTTAQLALGDALAVALLDARGFKPEDFARSHPGGALGRKLLTRVADVMREGDALPRVVTDANLSALMREMSKKGLGASAVADADGVLRGIFTDGDLRRLIEKGEDLRALQAGDVMFTRPRTLHAEALAVDAAGLMEEHRITCVLVVDAAGVLVGAVHIGDLMRRQSDMTPTLLTPCGSLPPEGAAPCLGRPGAAALTPSLNFPSDLLLKAQGIRIVFFDVDGVLTDGGLYFSETGETLKRFNTLDGHGLKLLQRAGITPAVITGRDSAALRKRLDALGITEVHYGTEDKRPAAEQTLAKLGLAWSQAAAMGDDWPDLAMMQRCALAVAPANAHAEALALAAYVTLAHGGMGAARELCDLLLIAGGQYARLLQEHLA